MAEKIEPPSLESLGAALFGSQIRRFEIRINERFDQLELLIEQQAVDQEALAQALEVLKTADTTIDSIEPEVDTP